MLQETFEIEFKAKLFEKYAKNQKYLIPKTEYFRSIELLKSANQQTSSKSRHEYYLLTKFEVLVCGDVEKLIKRRSSPEESPLYYVSIEETYDVINRAHVATGHGGRDRMLKHLGQKYANITTEAVELYKSYCKVCQEKKKRPRATGVVVKPIISREFNSRAQVDLIDMQSSPQGQFKWIMVYQCHLTKFVVLRPLSSKRASEVAFQLLDIFLLFGAPAILQSDNGSEFTAEVIRELKLLWPKLIMVHGKPRHPQSQGSVERANADIKDILVAWMSDNNTNDWSVGLKFVQQQKNCSHHSGINRTPYKAMFGEDPKVGLTSSNLPHDILERLQTEDDLLALSLPHLTNTESNQQPPSNHLSQSLQLEPSQIEKRLQDITVEREMAVASQVNQAERMVKRARVEFSVGEIGDNVAIPVPIVDRGRGAPRNILGVVVDRDENEMYRIAVKAGILAGRYARNQFNICPQQLLQDSDVSQDNEVTLRQALRLTSSGQGFFRCDCSKSKTQCQTNRCKCFKANRLCNSRCHNSVTCQNKTKQ